MAKEEITPSEWQIMEVLWACGEPLTSSEVYKRMQGNVDMSMRMVRVLMNRLNQKDILGYTVDEHDSRVYHYYVLKQKEECVKEKSRKFVDSYFSGSTDRACDAAPENAFFRTDFFERDAMGSISGHPISWEAEAVL